MLNIIHYQRNVNQNYNEISPHIGQKSHYKKKIYKKKVREDVEKREPSYIVGGNVN